MNEAVYTVYRAVMGFITRTFTSASQRESSTMLRTTLYHKYALTQLGRHLLLLWQAPDNTAPKDRHNERSVTSSCAGMHTLLFLLPRPLYDLQL